MGINILIIVEHRDNDLGKWCLTNGLECGDCGKKYFSVQELNSQCKHNYDYQDDYIFPVSYMLPKSDMSLMIMCDKDISSRIDKYGNEYYEIQEQIIKDRDEPIILSDLYSLYVNEYWHGKHGHSTPCGYFTIQDIDKYPWNKEIKRIGWVSKENKYKFGSLKLASFKESIDFSNISLSDKSGEHTEYVEWIETYKNLFIGYDEFMQFINRYRKYHEVRFHISLWY